MQTKLVEIFKTNIQNDKDANRIILFFMKLYPIYKINFDLEDEENILRIEASQIEIEAVDITKYMIEMGFRCERIE